MSAPRLHPDDVQAIARAVVELLRAEPAASPRLVDAAAVARALGVSRDTVYEHAERLGAWRLGDGPRARLRFDLADAVERWTTRERSEESEEGVDGGAAAIPVPRRRVGAGTALDSVPVRELQPRPLARNRPGAAATARGTAHEELAS